MLTILKWLTQVGFGLDQQLVL
jgi:hypothetical protein